MSREAKWFVAAAFASVILDAIFVVGFAASILWICYAAWLGAQRIRARSVDRFVLALSLSVPLLVYLVDFAVQEQVDRDMRTLSQSQDLKNAKRLDDIKAIDDMTWLTKTRLLWLIPDAAGPQVEARGFPYSILRYDLTHGEKLKRPFD